MSAHPGRGTIPSPNIWGTPEVYELENLASDRAGFVTGQVLYIDGGRTLV